ncbi:hypothetical protein B9Z65_6480 [Elsinoe australis]|uniref:Uncharacterized protein n=1 Tax=Elsinoe australis TaxID=40998 RepID=A0A2P8A8R3_9PEZI|nr:hypothetical protein B9Z65_6480 [Elsinoe australis]
MAQLSGGGADPPRIILRVHKDPGFKQLPDDLGKSLALDNEKVYDKTPDINYPVFERLMRKVTYTTVQERLLKTSHRGMALWFMQHGWKEKRFVTSDRIECPDQGGLNWDGDFEEFGESEDGDDVALPILQSCLLAMRNKLFYNYAVYAMVAALPDVLEHVNFKQLLLICNRYDIEDAELKIGFVWEAVFKDADKKDKQPTARIRSFFEDITLHDICHYPFPGYQIPNEECEKAFLDWKTSCEVYEVLYGTDIFGQWWEDLERFVISHQSQPSTFAEGPSNRMFNSHPVHDSRMVELTRTPKDLLDKLPGLPPWPSNPAYSGLVNMSHMIDPDWFYLLKNAPSAFLRSLYTYDVENPVSYASIGLPISEIGPTIQTAEKALQLPSLAEAALCMPRDGSADHLFLYKPAYVLLALRDFPISDTELELVFEWYGVADAGRTASAIFSFKPGTRIRNYRQISSLLFYQMLYLCNTKDYSVFLAQFSVLPNYLPGANPTHAQIFAFTHWARQRISRKARESLQMQFPMFSQTTEGRMLWPELDEMGVPSISKPTVCRSTDDTKEQESQKSTTPFKTLKQADYVQYRRTFDFLVNDNTSSTSRSPITDTVPSLTWCMERMQKQGSDYHWINSKVYILIKGLCCAKTRTGTIQDWESLVQEHLHDDASSLRDFAKHCFPGQPVVETVFQQLNAEQIRGFMIKASDKALKNPNYRPEMLMQAGWEESPESISWSTLSQGRFPRQISFRPRPAGASSMSTSESQKQFKRQSTFIHPEASVYKFLSGEVPTQEEEEEEAKIPAPPMPNFKRREQPGRKVKTTAQASATPARKTNKYAKPPGTSKPKASSSKGPAGPSLAGRTPSSRKSKTVHAQAGSQKNGDIAKPTIGETASGADRIAGLVAQSAQSTHESDSDGRTSISKKTLVLDNERTREQSKSRTEANEAEAGPSLTRERLTPPETLHLKPQLSLQRTSHHVKDNVTLTVSPSKASHQVHGSQQAVPMIAPSSSRSEQSRLRLLSSSLSQQETPRPEFSVPTLHSTSDMPRTSTSDAPVNDPNPRFASSRDTDGTAKPTSVKCGMSAAQRSFENDAREMLEAYRKGQQVGTVMTARNQKELLQRYTPAVIRSMTDCAAQVPENGRNQGLHEDFHKVARWLQKRHHEASPNTEMDISGTAIPSAPHRQFHAKTALMVQAELREGRRDSDRNGDLLRRQKMQMMLDIHQTEERRSAKSRLLDELDTKLEEHIKRSTESPNYVPEDDESLVFETTPESIRQAIRAFAQDQEDVQLQMPWRVQSTVTPGSNAEANGVATNMTLEKLQPPFVSNPPVSNLGISAQASTSLSHSDMASNASKDVAAPNDDKARGRSHQRGMEAKPVPVQEPEHIATGSAVESFKKPRMEDLPRTPPSRFTISNHARPGRAASRSVSRFRNPVSRSERVGTPFSVEEKKGFDNRASSLHLDYSKDEQSCDTGSKRVPVKRRYPIDLSEGDDSFRIKRPHTSDKYQSAVPQTGHKPQRFFDLTGQTSLSIDQKQEQQKREQQRRKLADAEAKAGSLQVDELE